MAPIRILQVVNSMNRGGAETTIMNLYRELDRSDIQFDFLVHDNKEAAYDNEIAELGGRRFISPAFRLFNYREYKSFLNKFFSEHPEYRIVHGHQYNTASIYLNVAKKTGP